MPDNTPATKADLETLKIELQRNLPQGFEPTEARIKAHFDKRTHDLETRLLRAFADASTDPYCERLGW